MNIRRLLLTLTAVTLLAGCGHDRKPAAVSFYWWRTHLALTPREQQALSDLRVRRLRVKLFDVVRDERGVHPDGILRGPAPHGLPEVLPVVFLRTSVFTADDSLLPQQILSERDGLCRQNGLRCHGLELDCDWTPSTRGRYFRLLAELTRQLHLRHETVHATLRLHQYRNPAATGVPPVDRLTLMAYNMGPVSASPKHQSILDLDALAGWLRASSYPKRLDLALPLWSWCLQIRDGRPIDLLQTVPEESLAALPQLKPSGNHLWTVKEGFFLQGRWLREEDQLKAETVTPELLAREVKILARALPPDTAREVVYFDLSERNLQRHEGKELVRLSDRLGSPSRNDRRRLRP